MTPMTRAATSSFHLVAVDGGGRGRPRLRPGFRGTVSGTVKDSTGAPLPGVTVTVTNTDTSVGPDRGDQRPWALSGAVPESGHLLGHGRTARVSRRWSRPATRSASPRSPAWTSCCEVGGRVGDRDGHGRNAAAEREERNQRAHRRYQADRAVAARRRHRLHADASGAGHHGLVGPALRPADGQRQPRRHRHQRRAGRQRVHDRRRAEHVQREGRRVLAALGCDFPVQGADQRVRRAIGTHRRRHGQPGAEERHQRPARPRSATSTGMRAGRPRRC